MELDPLLPHVFPLDLFVAEALKRAAQAALVYLEAVHLDGVLGADALLGEEDGSAISLVSLQLNDLAELGVFDDRAVACKLLLENLDDLLQVDFGIDSLGRTRTSRGGSGVSRRPTYIAGRIRARGHARRFKHAPGLWSSTCVHFFVAYECGQCPSGRFLKTARATAGSAGTTRARGPGPGARCGNRLTFFFFFSVS